MHRIMRYTALAIVPLAIGLAACSSSKKSSTTTTTTTTTVAPTTTTAKPGLTKAQIVAMQEQLDLVGCDVGPNDGIIGPLTIASIKSFQTGAGLTADGIYGPKTKTALDADAAAKKQVCKKPTPPVPPVGPTGAAAACTQSAIQTGVNTWVPSGTTATITKFGCDQGWAYALVTLTASGESIDATDVLASRNGVWVSQDRYTVCPSGKIPKDIYNPGCTTN